VAIFRNGYPSEAESQPFLRSQPLGLNKIHEVMLPDLALQSSQFTTTNRATQLEVVDLGISRLTKASGSQFQVKHR
jgi:hypothetical protein